MLTLNFGYWWVIKTKFNLFLSCVPVSKLPRKVSVKIKKLFQQAMILKLVKLQMISLYSKLSWDLILFLPKKAFKKIRSLISFLIFYKSWYGFRELNFSTWVKVALTVNSMHFQKGLQRHAVVLMSPLMSLKKVDVADSNSGIFPLE